MITSTGRKGCEHSVNTKEKIFQRQIQKTEKFNSKRITKNKYIRSTMSQITIKKHKVERRGSNTEQKNKKNTSEDSLF